MKYVVGLSVILCGLVPTAATPPPATMTLVANAQHALYEGRVPGIQKAFAHDGVATKAVKNDAREGLRLLMFAVDMVPRMVLSSGGGAAWEATCDLLDAHARRVTPEKFGVWARHEAMLFRLLLDARRSGKAEPGGELVKISREISRSEPGGTWTMRCYERAHEIMLRRMHVEGSNPFMTLGHLVYLRAKMDQRPHMFPRHGIPTATAAFKYAEARSNLVSSKPDVDKARRQVENGMSYVLPFTNAPGVQPATLARHNDLVWLSQAHPELELAYDAQAAPFTFDVYDATVLRGALQRSLRCRSFRIGGVYPELHVWFTAPEGTLRRTYRVRAYETKRRGTARHGADRTGLARSWAKDAEAHFSKVKRRTAPKRKAFSATWKSTIRAALEGTGHDGQPLHMAVFVHKGPEHSVLLEVVDHGTPMDPLPPDVVAFEASLR